MGIKLLIITLTISILFIAAFSGFYGYWNSAPPDRTCMSCHEIAHSYDTWAVSAHRNTPCMECHGTALSNGFHSLREKSRMVFRHFSENTIQDIALNEEQVIEMNQTCKRCHQAEYAAWISSGHSVDYAHIFLDKHQNRSEQLNHDCLRCHGMFYEEDIYALVEPIDIEGPWRLTDPSKTSHPVIPCLACHSVHQAGSSKASFQYTSSDSIHFDRTEMSLATGFYDRHEKMHFNAAVLPQPVIMQGENPVRVSSDPMMRVCIQCHAPNAWHQAGSSDDRTPTGVHEGISCLGCHDKHSNSTWSSCVQCHPAISNCGLDVRSMNTSYANTDSPNNIHFVSCNDCHSIPIVLDEQVPRQDQTPNL